MSSRIVRRFGPAAMLVAALAAPAPAQETPVAPPRAGTAHDFAALRRHMGMPVPIAVSPATHGRGYITVCTQNLREDVFELARTLPGGCAGCGTKDVAFVIGAGGLKRVMPMPEPPRFLVPPTPIPTGSFVIHEDGRVVAATAATKATGCAGCAAKSDGTWYREVSGTVVAVTFAGDTLTAKVTTRDGDTHATVTVTAHCTATKDGLVFGAVTGADVAPLGDKAPKMELAELSMSLQELVDHPFSFRAKMTSEGLSVSGLKIGGFERDKKELLALCGLYKHAKDGKVSEPKPQKVEVTKIGRCEDYRPAGATVGVTIGSAIGGPGTITIGSIEGKPPVTVEAVGADGLRRVGVDFSMPVPTMPRPVPPACTPVPADVKPISVAFPNDAMKQMAADVFGQMMLPPATVPSTGGAQLPRLPLPRPQTGFGGMTLPSPKYLEHYPQYFAPDPAFPLPRELAAQDGWRVIDPCYPERYNHAASQATVTPFAVQAHNGTAAASTPVVPQPKHVGTWVREVGSKRCVLKITPDHFTLTVSEAREGEGGKTVTAYLTFTVEYHLARDGVTAVGLVTGADVRFEGDPPDHDVVDTVRKTGELQKMLEDMPLAASLRTYSDALVVGSVRMPTWNGLMESEPTAYLNGRYRLMTEKALSPLKATKAPKPMVGLPGTPTGANGTPVGAYGSAQTGDLLPPQYVPPATYAPPPPPVALPAIPKTEGLPPTGIVPTYGVTIPDPKPVRVMPMPKPLGAVVPVKGEKQTYSDDPNVRMQKLLERSEDLRQIQNEWRRFWFPEKPDHLKPERIHGGIY